MTTYIPSILAVSRSDEYTFTKQSFNEIRLIEGEGIEGDVHRGKHVRHQVQVRKDPTKPNLRQVHLLAFEMIQELKAKGFSVAPGILGENITTKNIDLLSLPRNTILSLGPKAKIRITGLRNPCSQLDHYQKGLSAAVLDKDKNGKLIRRIGVMGIVLVGGVVLEGDPIQVELPPTPHQELDIV